MKPTTDEIKFTNLILGWKGFFNDRGFSGMAAAERSESWVMDRKSLSLIPKKLSSGDIRIDLDLSYDGEINWIDLKYGGLDEEIWSGLYDEVKSFISKYFAKHYYPVEYNPASLYYLIVQEAGRGLADYEDGNMSFEQFNALLPISNGGFHKDGTELTLSLYHGSLEHEICITDDFPCPTRLNYGTRQFLETFSPNWKNPTIGDRLKQLKRADNDVPVSQSNSRIMEIIAKARAIN